MAETDRAAEGEEPIAGEGSGEEGGREEVPPAVEAAGEDAPSPAPAPAEEGAGGEEVSPADHLDEQLGDESGLEEALQAWAEGGHALDELDEEEIAAVRFPQLEPTVPKVHKREDLLDNVEVDITVELGRKEMTVAEIVNLKEQDVIELDKLAGEAFDIRVNGRLFAAGEVVVVTDMMAVRLTSLVQNPDTKQAESDD